MPDLPDATEGPLPCPAPILRVADRLREAGHRSWLTGDALLRLVAGIGAPTGTPDAVELLTSAAPDEVLACLERAVPIRPDAAALLVPTATGPVDVVPCRRGDPPRGDLAVRDFTIHAMALDLLGGAILDPFAGRPDWDRAVLRCPGPALHRLRERPERALRALRCVSEHRLEADDELRAALPRVAEALGPVCALAARREIFRWLSLDDPAPGLRLARESGLEAALAPGARATTPEQIARIPTTGPLRIPVRLAAWLHGASAPAFLRRFRMGEPVSSCVLRLLAHHPVEQTVRPSSEASVARLQRRLAAGELTALIAWREVELADDATDGQARARLAALREALVRAEAARDRDLRRRALALHGADVMRILGCAPGPVVGRALSELADWIEEDPARNTAIALEQRLVDWARETR